jgi:hypothetical protein
MSSYIIPEDKANHCIYGAVAFLVMLAVFTQFKVAGSDIAAAISVLAGAVVWELYRKYRYDYKPDIFDVLWSMAGPCACLVARVL